MTLLTVAITASVLSSEVIPSWFPDRPRPRDLLFELLPYVDIASYLTLLALVIGFSLFLGYGLRHERSRFPEFIVVFALMYLTRAILTVLTPLASAQGDGPFVFTFQQYGMFPSGHAAAALVLMLLTSRERAAWSRRVQGILVVLVCAGLLLAHGHYSIDIAGGLLLGYFVVQVWEHGSLFNPLKRLMGIIQQRGAVSANS